ncbi:integrin beta-1-like [Mytilus trossulus]|uniref:integrin beta-1-like n=1 Tax=Mytilus trossulus TaxID=6551 RepID=UPI003004F1FF
MLVLRCVLFFVLCFSDMGSAEENVECDNRSCNYFNNALCGGPAHGTCVCGTCSCNPGYTGEECGCTTNTDNCMSSDGSICNNQGYCECGRCRCKEGSHYLGPLCGDCKDCNKTG